MRDAHERTTFRPQRPRSTAPSRRRLLETVRVSAAHVVVVAAGAGFRTAMLLAYRVASLDRHEAWVALDASDNGSPRFWSYVLGSLPGAVPRCAANGGAKLRSKSRFPLDARTWKETTAIS